MGFKSPKPVIFNFYVQNYALGDSFETLRMYICMCCVKQLAIKTKFFHSC